MTVPYLADLLAETLGSRNATAVMAVLNDHQNNETIARWLHTNRIMIPCGRWEKTMYRESSVSDRAPDVASSEIVDQLPDGCTPGVVYGSGPRVVYRTLFKFDRGQQ